MASVMVKVTFTVDALTADSIRELAEAWGVPKSEAVRRAVRQAKESQLLKTPARTPVAVLEQLESAPPLSRGQTKARLASAEQVRNDWNPRRRKSSG